MNRRRRKLLSKRLLGLPGGKDFVYYSVNKMKHLWLKVTNSTRVARPSTVMLEVTNLCNLRCRICPRESEYGQQMDKGEMDIQSLKQVVDELSPYVDSIGLTGLGEPLLYQHLEEAINYIREKNKGIVITLSTNAYVKNLFHLSENLLSKVDSIQISMDGTDKIYETFRGGARFSTFLKNVRQMIDHVHGGGTELMFNMVVQRDNYKQMVPVASVANKLKIAQVSYTLFNLAAMDHMDNNYYDFYISDDFISETEELRMFSKQHPETEILLWDQQTPPGFRKCPFPWNHYYITWDGYLVPCCAKPFPKTKHFGNVFSNGLMNCLNSPDFINFRRDWQENRTPSFCSNCHMVKLPSPSGEGSI